MAPFPHHRRRPGCDRPAPALATAVPSLPRAAARTAGPLKPVPPTGLHPRGADRSAPAAAREPSAVDQALRGRFRATDLLPGLAARIGPCRTPLSPPRRRRATTGRTALTALDATTATDPRPPLSCAPPRNGSRATHQTAALVPATHLHGRKGMDGAPSAHAVTNSVTHAVSSTAARTVPVTLANEPRRYGWWPCPCTTGPPPPRAELTATTGALGTHAAYRNAPGARSLWAAQRLQAPLAALWTRTAASVARPPTPPPP